MASSTSCQGLKGKPRVHKHSESGAIPGYEARVHSGWDPSLSRESRTFTPRRQFRVIGMFSSGRMKTGNPHGENM